MHSHLVVGVGLKLASRETAGKLKEKKSFYEKRKYRE
jgi:hypothetical protein